MILFVAYLWVWNSWDEDVDVDLISMYWNKISKEEALAIFVNQTYQWFDIQNNYKIN